MKNDPEALAAALEASGSNYRVLRRLLPRQQWYADPAGTVALKHGLIVDVETTGLDPAQDEIIELAMLPFTFSAEGEIFEAFTPWQSYREPSRPIPAEITALTGITAETVAGRTIEAADVAAFIAGADLIVAHHAAFDRPFAETLCEAFVHKCWGCSGTEIDWRARGSESTKLGWLLYERGLFYERHQATEDCQAVLELLAAPWKDGLIPFAELIERARKPTCRLWAIGSPFETKDVLKARGYRWNAGDNGLPKSWYIDIGEDAIEAEKAFLGSLYPIRSRPIIDHFTAFDRFSKRMNP